MTSSWKNVLSDYNNQRFVEFLMKMLLVCVLGIALPVSLSFWMLTVVFNFSDSVDGNYHASPIRWLVALCLPLWIAHYATKRRSLDVFGALAAIFIGFTLTMANYCFISAMLCFFLTSSKVTKFKEYEKKKFDADFRKGGQRNWMQVISNGGMATELAILYMLDVGCVELPIDFINNFRSSYWAMAVLSAMSCANGDTWASELATVTTRQKPRLITTMSIVPKGTNGGITFFGIFFSAIGGTVVGVAYYFTLWLSLSSHVMSACPPQWPIILLATCAGLFGSTVDSLLGATLQYSGLDEKLGKVVDAPGEVSSRSTTGASECISEICNKTADDIIKNMNESVDPCDDFYEFSCGGYMKRTIPTHKPKIAVYIDKAEILKEQVKGLLTRKNIKGPAIVKTLIKKYIDTCMTSGSQHKSRQHLLTDFDKLGGFPVLKRNWNEGSFDITDTLVKMFKNGFGRNALLSVVFDVDESNAYKVTPYIGEPSLVPGRHYLLNHLKNKNDSTVKAYFSLMEKVVNHLGADNATSKCDMKEVLQFSMELAAVTMTSSEKANSIPSKMTIGDLYNSGREIDWLKMLKKGFEADHVSKHEVIKVARPKTLVGINKLLKKFPKRTVANFLLWSMTFEALPNLDESFLNLFDEYRSKGFSLTSRKPKFIDCQSHVTGRLLFALSSLYVTNFFNPLDKLKVESMTKKLIAEFSESLSNLSWMDNKTRKHAFKKLNTYTYTVGYFSEFANQTIMNSFLSIFNFTDNFYENNKQVLVSDFMLFADYIGKSIDKLDFRILGQYAHTINAYYYNRMNIAFLPAALIGAYYIRDAAKFNNYAKIGYPFLHELSHAFDANGRKRDHNGIVNNWWSPQSLKDYKTQEKCVIDQYSNYTFKGEKVNGKLTVGENIADNLAIIQSYKAYGKVINDDQPIYKLRNYTKKKLFWIASAQFYCAKYTKKEAIKDMKNDVHTVSKHRVNGFVSNQKEFSEDFGCLKTTEMNPSKKCVFW